MQPEPLAGHHTQMTVPSQPFAELASFLEFVPDAMVIINQDGTMVLVNAQTEHLFGYGRHELIGKPVEMLVPQRFRARHVAHRQAYFGAPCPRLMGDDGELCARRQDGSEFAMEISLKPFETTEELLVSCAIRNITERKQLEQELRASEQHLHLIMDSVPALIAYVDKNLRYQFVNRTFARWHDIPTTNIAGTHLSDIRSERAYQQLRQYAERVLSGRQFSTETAMPKRHGGSRDVHATYTPHVDQQGNVQGYFALVQDITEHKQTERDLQESTERLRLLLETTDAIPWEADAKTWRFTYVGPQVETLFCYPLAQWYEEDFWAKHLHPDDRDSAIDFCLHASSRREQYAFEYRMVTADGGIVWLQDMVRVVPVHLGPRAPPSSCRQATARLIHDHTNVLRPGDHRRLDQANPVPQHLAPASHWHTRGGVITEADQHFGTDRCWAVGAVSIATHRAVPPPRPAEQLLAGPADCGPHRSDHRSIGRRRGAAPLLVQPDRAARSLAHWLAGGSG